jgi:uroporphyrinogen-III decarboxylase
MTGRERMAAAMRLEKPDRTPVMCQLAIGHYFLNTAVPREEIWFSAEGFAEALATLARRYRFDGALVNLLPAPPEWRSGIARVSEEPGGMRVIEWKGGGGCRIPPDDNLHHFPAYEPPPFDAVRLEDLWYDDPHGVGGMRYPFRFRTAGRQRRTGDRGRGTATGYFPEYLFRTVALLRERAGEELSVHAEVFSPFTQLMELFGYGEALMRLVTDAERCEGMLARYAGGTAELAGEFARRGADAVLVSSAFAGAGFISREFYRRFVQPYERRVVEAVKAASPQMPVYVHTCGAIGDRLELMVETGFNGIDTLDPPPLGDVELADAVRRLRGKAFIKGNMDPVGTLLNGTPEAVRQDARMRLRTAGREGGYILSSACSVAPGVEAETLMVLAEEAER